MVRKMFLLVFVAVFLLSAYGVYADQADIQPTAQPFEKTKDRASRAMNNIFLGPTEIPDNLSSTGTKGTAVTRCTPKTRTGVERGIARFVTGVWQLATFWYSDPGSAPASSTAAAPAPAASSSIK